MRPFPLLLLVFGLTAALSPVVGGAKSIELPPDTTPWRVSPLPGYKKVSEVCIICHTAQYAEYQPPNASRAYWEAMVKRMQTVFKAPIRDEDVPAIVDYLAKTYGPERIDP